MLLYPSPSDRAAGEILEVLSEILCSQGIPNQAPVAFKSYMALSSSSTEIFNFTISIAAIKLITQFKRNKSRREIPKGKKCVITL